MLAKPKTDKSSRGLNVTRHQGLMASRLSFQQWQDLTSATFALLSARISFGRKPTKAIFQSLIVPPSKTLRLPAENEGVVRRISWAVQTAAPRIPWRADCVIQAMAAQKLLRNHSIDSTGYLGVGHDEDKAFMAHVWLMYGDIYVTGYTAKPLVPILDPQNIDLAV